MIALQTEKVSSLSIAAVNGHVEGVERARELARQLSCPFYSFYMGWGGSANIGEKVSTCKGVIAYEKVRIYGESGTKELLIAVNPQSH